MLNYINKYVYLPKIAPLNWGIRGVMGIRGVQVGVRYDRGVVMVPPCGIHTKKMFVPPNMVSGLGGWGGPCSGWGGRKGWFYLS